MKREERKQRTKNLIKSSFIQLLKEKDLNRITITEISELADVNRKTFYYYFDSIAAILDSIEEDLVADLKIKMENSESHNWKEFFYGLNEVIESEFDFFEIIARESSLSFLKDECADVLTALLVNQLLVRTNRDSETNRIIVSFITNGIIGVYSTWLRTDSKSSIDEIITKMSRTIDNALDALE